MFGIGAPELVVIVIVALLVVGPRDLPRALQQVGRGIGEFRKATRQLRDQVGYDEMVDQVTRPLREGIDEVNKARNELRRAVASPLGDPSPLANPAAPHAPRAVLDFAFEYPEGGPDDYGALPDDAPADYPPVAPVYSRADAEALEGTVSRSVAPTSVEPEPG